MDWSLHEASRSEQSQAAKNAFFGPIGTKERVEIPYIRVLLVFQKWVHFLQAKDLFFSCFLAPCVSDTSCRFIPCNLSCLIMSSNKQLIFMKPNIKGTKNSTSGTARAKVAVTRQQRHAEKTVVHSQPRRWRSLTR